MRISLTRQFKVSMGNYENYQFGATVTVDHGDLGLTDESVQERVAADPKYSDTLRDALRAWAEETLDLLLIDDVRSSQDLTEDERSYILRSFTSQQPEQPQPQPPAKSPRRPRASTR